MRPVWKTQIFAKPQPPAQPPPQPAAFVWQGWLQYCLLYEGSHRASFVIRCVPEVESAEEGIKAKEYAP
jgi:hypothetical protein